MNCAADFFLDRIDPAGRILLYPSSCRLAREFQSLPYDDVILNSYCFSACQRVGKVTCLNLDNNELLAALRARGMRLAALTIIRDGCLEGGNYECAASESFFGRALPLMGEDFLYCCDHRRTWDLPVTLEPVPTPEYLQPLRRHSRELGPLAAFRVSQPPHPRREFQLGQVRVRLFWRSIWQDGGEYDHLYLSGSRAARIAQGHYLDGAPWPGGSAADMSHVQGVTIQPLLHEADLRHWERVACTPFANGKYRTIVRQIAAWQRPYPQEIAFYHLNRGDYAALTAAAQALA